LRGCTFSLDYDDTITRDPGLWRLFIDEARKRNHSVYIITARWPNNIKDIEAAFPDVEVIPCSGQPKNKVAQENLLTIDVWVDDMPQIIMEEVWQPTTQA
jgi:hypothetical protein